MGDGDNVVRHVTCAPSDRNFSVILEMLKHE